MPTLRFAPGILRRLGEELNPNPDQGIIELARNAYDADALTCTIEFLKTEGPLGAIRVCDDGVGMNREELINGWLVLGRSLKESRRERTSRGRRVVGNKGLGRLAALRLGRVATLETRPEGQQTNYRLEIDWERFEDSSVVESVSIPIEEWPRHHGERHGTTITVRELRASITRADVRRLARSLVLLADPFVEADANAFRPRLVAPEFRDLEALVRNAYFDQAEFHLVATVDLQGRATARLMDYKGATLFEASHRDISVGGEPYSTPPAHFELWWFLLDAQTFSTRSATLAEVRHWIQEVGGVHLYQDGLRVHPYGDRGHDWLEMNLARARSPEYRPSTNNSIGRVSVSGGGDALVQKTDRSGFLENQAFLELRRFGVEVLQWMARRRLREREARREKSSREVPTQVSAAESKLLAALVRVPRESRIEIQRAMGTYQKARAREVQSLRDDLQLYRTLSTVGTTSAVLAHELKRPVRQIATLAKLVHRITEREFGALYRTRLASPIEHILNATEALRTFANVTTTLLEREKRRRGRVVVGRVVEGLVGLFVPFMTEAKVVCQVSVARDEPAIYGSVAAVESIVANLLTNSLNAFAYGDLGLSQRVVRVRTRCVPGAVVLEVADNGPGIRDLGTDDIWLPGQTTTPGGTGLGLTIVRDAVAELGGSATALANGDMGGAEFIVSFPHLEVA